MSDTVDIGAARVRLIVDAADFDKVIEQGKNAVRGFGTVAQASYDKTEKGTRRAADALLDYVNSLGRADTTMDRFIRNASRMGVEKPVIDAATQAWAKHNDAVEQAAISQADNELAVKRAQAALKELMTTQAEQERQSRNSASAAAQERAENLAAARAANAQQDINRLVAPGLTDGGSSAKESAQAFAAIIEEQAAAEADNAAAIKRSQVAYQELITTQQAEEKQLRDLANAAAAVRIELLAQNRAAQSQQDINRLVAPGLENTGNTNSRRLDLEAAFAETVQKENDDLEKQRELVQTIAVARAQQTATTAQQDFNKLLGIPEQERALQLAIKRRDAEAAFLPQLEAEARAEAEVNQKRATGDAFVKELQNIDAAAGKTYYELLSLKAAQLGITDTAGPLIAKIKAQNEAMGAGTISAKQYQFALRGLPAQFTDVIVSLQAGQNPFTVLLQQGGQVKDMFGGLKTAASAVGKEFLKLATNPWVLLAVAIGAVAAAAYATTSRMADLAIATAKGNQIAGNARGLGELAESLNKIGNISIGNADAAVKTLASAGKLTGENFREAAQAAARWATVTGESVDEVAGKFNQIAGDPMQAVLDGTLRVTEAQYAQLAALERVGDKAGEVALAVKLYQDQINDNSASVLANLSEGAKAWIDLKDAISGAAHSLAQFVTETAGLSFEKLKSFNFNGIAAGLAQAVTDPFGGAKSTFDALTAPPPGERTTSGFGGVGTDGGATGAAAAQNAKLTLDQVAANRELQKSFDELGTHKQKFDAAVVLENGLLSRASDDMLRKLDIVKSATGAFSGPGYDKLVNGLHLKFFGANAGGDPTKPIKEWEKTVLDSLKVAQTGVDNFYADNEISAQQYYSVDRALAEAQLSTQLESIDKQKAALKGRENSESNIAALEQQRQTAEQEFALKKAKIDRDEVLAVRAREIALRNYSQALADGNIQLSRAGDLAIKAVGMGSTQLSLYKSLSDARYQAALAERAIDQAEADHAITAADAEQKRTDNAAALSVTLTLLQGNYDNLKTAEGSWLAGSNKAWQDWYENTTNYAAEAGKQFTLVMDDAANAIADAALKGKLSFTTLLQDIEKEIITFEAKKLLAEGLKVIIGGSNTGGSTGLSGLLSLFSGSFLGSANGNAFSAGSGLAAYHNSVVTQPTYFPFAKGGVPNVGLMGEKSGSPGEAIMPLTRTSGGELAVKATGQGQRPSNYVTQNIIVPGAVQRSTQDQVSARVYGSAQRAIRRNG